MILKDIYVHNKCKSTLDVLKVVNIGFIWISTMQTLGNNSVCLC